jgi:hypothetical protein
MKKGLLLIVLLVLAFLTRAVDCGEPTCDDLVPVTNVVSQLGWMLWDTLL